MSASSPKPWGEAPSGPARSNLSAPPDAVQGWRRRIVPLLTALFLISGGALHLVNIHLESVVISHTSRSAMIFGLVGLRRVQQNQIEDADNAGGPTA